MKIVLKNKLRPLCIYQLGRCFLHQDTFWSYYIKCSKCTEHKVKKYTESSELLCVPEKSFIVKPRKRKQIALSIY